MIPADEAAFIGGTGRNRGRAVEIAKVGSVLVLIHHADARLHPLARSGRGTPSTVVSTSSTSKKLLLWNKFRVKTSEKTK